MIVRCVVASGGRGEVGEVRDVSAHAKTQNWREKIATCYFTGSYLLK